MKAVANAMAFLLQPIEEKERYQKIPLPVIGFIYSAKTQPSYNYLFCH